MFNIILVLGWKTIKEYHMTHIKYSNEPHSNDTIKCITDRVSSHISIILFWPLGVLQSLKIKGYN